MEGRRRLVRIRGRRTADGLGAFAVAVAPGLALVDRTSVAMNDGNASAGGETSGVGPALGIGTIAVAIDDRVKARTGPHPDAGTTATMHDGPVEADIS